MRAFVAACLLLSACAGGGGEANNLVEPPEKAVPVNLAGMPSSPANGLSAAAPNLEPPEDPALAAMSPYRRREYERGWRDCMTGSYDRERQGESYRIGCMAAEEAKEAAGR